MQKNQWFFILSRRSAATQPVQKSLCGPRCAASSRSAAASFARAARLWQTSARLCLVPSRALLARRRQAPGAKFSVAGGWRDLGALPVVPESEKIIFGRLNAIEALASKQLEEEGFKREDMKFIRYINCRYNGTDTSIMTVCECKEESLNAYKKNFRKNTGKNLTV